MLAIKNNIMAGNAARHLGKSYDALATSVERLSSGLRINSAKDDAAGLAVRELIRADVAVLQQGSRNASDGISMLQTMEGALGVIDENLLRMKELAEQAVTGSYSSDQRTIMDAEFKEMAAEIDRIAGAAKFNDISMLNSSTGSLKVHVGTTTTIDIDKVDMTSTGLNIQTGTAGYQAVSDHGVTSSSSGAWLTLTNAHATAAEDQTLAIQFGSEAAVSVTLSAAANTATTFTLDEVVQAINAVSLNLAVKGDGTVQAYTMASVSHNATDGKDYLKLESRASDASSMTMTLDSSTTTTASGGLVLAANQAATDVTEASGANATDDGRMVKSAGTGINILTTDAATTALSRLTTAITTKDTARAKFGYKMNRLESTISVLDIQAENLQTAESRISDVDVATEMATMTRNQVLAQAGVSMLAQANSMPQMALTLLR